MRGLKWRRRATPPQNMEWRRNRWWLWALAALVMGATLFVAVRSVWWDDSCGTMGGRLNLIFSRNGAISLSSTRWHGSSRDLPFRFSKWRSVKLGADERVKMQFFAFRVSAKEDSNSGDFDGWRITIGYVWILGLELLIFVPLVWKYGQYERREMDSAGGGGGRRHHRIVFGWLAALVIVGTGVAAVRSLSWTVSPLPAPIGSGFKCSSCRGAFAFGWIGSNKFVASLPIDIGDLMLVEMGAEEYLKPRLFILKWYSKGSAGKPIMGGMIGYGWILLLEILIFAGLLWKYRRQRERSEPEAGAEAVKEESGSDPAVEK